ncbi:MAG: response regulator [Desulfobulbaceae bacterium]|uniref:Response regulator n=1 Tax=Candidatus Desulfobia pelagia TaxID=2841692 RepID=A0A8J6TFH8_9BACT|nr:response regulator [Candidatus Desulfobia pelagia]
MANIAIFSADFCNGSSVVKEVLDRTNLTLITDGNIIATAAKNSGMSEAKIERVFSTKVSVFNKFTHERERALANLKLVVAEMLSKNNLLMAGYLGHLIPRTITPVLKVCLVGDIRFRASIAARQQGLSEEAAHKTITALDAERAHWVHTLFDVDSPWSPELYDIVIPMDKTSVTDAAALIEEYMQKDVLQPTEASSREIENSRLASEVEVALAREGHDIFVEARDGAITLTINKQVIMQSRLEQELKAITERVPGVKSIETKLGRTYHEANIYRKYDFELPSKVLLVDDEQEFVQTLSERLILRDMGAAVAQDGQSALNMIAEDQPEVMVLDLKMPGIDGIEVLRRVKETHPEVEVIVLTGHGSEADRVKCIELGAFAYMHKPVDIDLLSKKLKEANDKIRGKNTAIA